MASAAAADGRTVAAAGPRRRLSARITGIRSDGRIWVVQRAVLIGDRERRPRSLVSPPWGSGHRPPRLSWRKAALLAAALQTPSMFPDART